MTEHNEDLQILAAVRAGASPHQIAKQWQISLPETLEYFRIVQAESKASALSQRVVLRSLLREQSAAAIQTIRLTMEGIKKVEGKNQPIQTKQDIDLAALKLKAAEAMLKHAQRFISEDSTENHAEGISPLLLQETLFDFEEDFEAEGPAS